MKIVFFGTKTGGKKKKQRLLAAGLDVRDGLEAGTPVLAAAQSSLKMCVVASCLALSFTKNYFSERFFWLLELGEVLTLGCFRLR